MRDSDVSDTDKNNSSIMIDILTKRKKHHRNKSIIAMSKSVLSSPKESTLKPTLTIGQFNIDNLPKFGKRKMRNF
jgi:hypothetical protein